MEILYERIGLKIHIWCFFVRTWIKLFFFLFREAGSEGVLLHHEDGVGDTGVEDILE